MTKKILGQIVAILSTTLVVGGIAIMGISYMALHNSTQSAEKDFLPAMQKKWAIETSTPQVNSSALLSGTYIGVIQIASLKLKVNIFEGTDNSALAKGAGHFKESVMPGESDNSVIAGHRDTVFAPLARIKIGAPVVIITRDGTFTYRVTSTRVVDKNDRTVIVPTESATLTLSTCYPFRFVGSAPERFIVTGLLVPRIL